MPREDGEPLPGREMVPGWTLRDVFKYFKSCQRVEGVGLFLLVLKNKTSAYRESKEALSKCSLLPLLLEVVSSNL